MVKLDPADRRSFNSPSWLALSTIISILILVSFFSPQLQFGQFGSHDFIEYWSAFQLYSTGQNPYDPSLIEPIQRHLGWREEPPLMMWNPPWTFVLMAPVLGKNFYHASGSWLCANIILLLLTIELTIRIAFGPPVRTSSRIYLYAVTATVLCYPAWIALSAGQVSILLAFCSAAALWAIKGQRMITGGIFLSVLTIKVHLFYLLFLFLAYWALRSRTYRLIASFAGSVSILALMTTAISPMSTLQWLQAHTQNQFAGTLIATDQWYVATLVGPIRFGLKGINGFDSTWLLYAIPGATAVAFLAWLSRRPFESKISIWRYFSVLNISLITSPFGWVFDFVTLLPSQIIVATWSIQKASGASSLQQWAFGLSLLLQIVTFALHEDLRTSHHQYFWYPIVWLGIWLFAASRPKADKNVA